MLWVQYELKQYILASFKVWLYSCCTWSSMLGESWCQVIDPVLTIFLVFSIEGTSLFRCFNPCLKQGDLLRPVCTWQLFAKNNICVNLLIIVGTKSRLLADPRNLRGGDILKELHTSIAVKLQFFFGIASRLSLYNIAR